MRSPTAADLVAGWNGFQTDFAGLSKDAEEHLSAEQIHWADRIFVMERRQKKRLSALFGAHLAGKRIGVLDVPDRFGYMDPDLVRLLERKLTFLTTRVHRNS